MIEYNAHYKNLSQVLLDTNISNDQWSLSFNQFHQKSLWTFQRNVSNKQRLLKKKNHETKPLKSKLIFETVRHRQILLLLTTLLKEGKLLKFSLLNILNSVVVCQHQWLRWSSLNPWERNELLNRLYLQHLMKPALFFDESWWKIKNFESGQREKRTLNEFRMKDLTYSKVPWLNERRKVKTNMLNESIQSDSKRPKTKNESWQRFNESELRFWGRCSKQERMSIKKEKQEILSKNTLISVQLFMHQSLETDFH